MLSCLRKASCHFCLASFSKTTLLQMMPFLKVFHSINSCQVLRIKYVFMVINLWSNHQKASSLETMEFIYPTLSPFEWNVRGQLILVYTYSSKFRKGSRDKSVSFLITSCWHRALLRGCCDKGNSGREFWSVMVGRAMPGNCGEFFHKKHPFGFTGIPAHFFKYYFSYSLHSFVSLR